MECLISGFDIFLKRSTQTSVVNSHTFTYKTIGPANNPAQLESNPSRRCLHFEVVGGLEWSNDPESYAGDSVATGRASLAGKVKGDDPD